MDFAPFANDVSLFKSFETIPVRYISFSQTVYKTAFGNCPSPSCANPTFNWCLFVLHVLTVSTGNRRTGLAVCGVSSRQCSSSWSASNTCPRECPRSRPRSTLCASRHGISAPVKSSRSWSNRLVTWAMARSKRERERELGEERENWRRRRE